MPNSQDPRDIRIDEFVYPLEDGRIAKYPLTDRSSARLVVDDGEGIRDALYQDLPSLLPENSLLVLNDTRVFHARLLFRKESGALVEVFCLEPEEADFQQAFASTGPLTWKVLIGNARRWKSGVLSRSVMVNGMETMVTAERLETDSGKLRVRLGWDRAVSFGELVDAFGLIPIPPYLHRESEELDKSSYQTVYARERGSVAAPTAGLHFTPGLLSGLSAMGHSTAFLTLHVGAGTFKPVVDEAIGSHEMHPEHFEVDLGTLRTLRDKAPTQPLFAVGTTSVRTLESLYWAGLDRQEPDNMGIGQWRPYEAELGVPVGEALDRLIRRAEEKGLDKVEGLTRLMIAPGYRFRLVDGLLTNFHMPRSTLLLLVSALAGDRWKLVYEHALQQGYRFLSYGDSCLFLPR